MQGRSVFREFDRVLRYRARGDTDFPRNCTSEPSMPSIMSDSINSSTVCRPPNSQNRLSPYARIKQDMQSLSQALQSAT